MPPDSSRVRPAKPWGAMVPMLLGILAGALAVSMVNTALPRIAGNLGIDDETRSWVVGAYPLAMAGTIVLGARLGDRFGRRTVLGVGLGGYALLNALAAVQTSGVALIGIRALLGVMAALVIASVVSTIGALFRGRDLVIANGLWVATFGTGSAVGPTLGGWLTEVAGWQSVFLTCAPIAGLGLALVWLVPNTRAADPAPWDVVSIATSTLGLAATLYGLQRLAFEPMVGGAVLVAGAALLAVFWARQRRLFRPFLDVRLFDDAPFSLAAVQIFVAAGSASAATYLLSVHLQSAAGADPTAAGIALLPQAVATIVGGMAAGLAVRALGDRGALVLALAVQAAGLGWLGVTPTASIAPLACIGFGMGVVGTLATSRLFEVAPVSRAGDVGAVQEIAFALGSAAWIALLDVVTVRGGASGFTLALALAAAVVAAVAVLSAADLLRRRQG